MWTKTLKQYGKCSKSIGTAVLRSRSESVHFGWSWSRSRFESLAPDPGSGSSLDEKEKILNLFTSFVPTLIKGKLKNKFCTYKKTNFSAVVRRMGCCKKIVKNCWNPTLFMGAVVGAGTGEEKARSRSETDRLRNTRWDYTCILSISSFKS